MEESLKIVCQIGREPQGEFIHKVADSYESVSRSHAEFFKTESGYILLDKSSNGTYVNGLRIKKSNVTSDDFVQLGGVEKCYVLDVSKIIQDLDKEEEKRRTDYSQEFKMLEEIYNDYDRRKNKLIKNSKINGNLPRIVLSIVMILAIYLFPIPSDLKYPLIMGVGILGMAFSIVSKSEQAMKKKLEKLVIEYNRIYVCPKCKSKLNIQSKSYNLLLEDGKCPYKSCNAIYK